MPFDLIVLGTASAGFLATVVAFYRIIEEAGLLDRGISEDLVRTPEQSRRMTARFWEVFWSVRRRLDRMVLIGGIATVIVSFILIASIAS